MLSNSSKFPAALPAQTPLQSGNFLIEGVLGQGGAGITYFCMDMGLRRAAAIKEFFPLGCTRVGTTVQPGNTLADAEYEAARESFIEEARTLARFSHPGIVDVFTVFVENNSAYMVMEYLSGASLAQIVEQRGPLPEAEAIGYIRQVGTALKVVHGQAMLHRDVKPDNIVVKEDGTAVLIDFGLTQKLQTTTGLGTRQLSSDSRFGTAGYAPLEQYSRQAQTGVYTDVYALAATLYHLVTAQEPPEATERAAGLELPDPRLANPNLSAATVQALVQGLAMDARERPQSVSDFIELLHNPPQLQAQAQPAPSRRPPPEPKPIRIDVPGYSSETPRAPEPRRSPQPRRAPEPEPEPFSEFPDPFPRAPMPILMPGTGCIRAPGCGCGCFVFMLLFLLQLFGSFFTFIDF